MQKAVKVDAQIIGGNVLNALCELAIGGEAICFINV